MLDVILLVIFVVVTYLIAREGFWGSFLTLWDIIFAGLFAFGTFEAVGGWIEENIGWLGGFPRFLSLAALFGGSLAALRWATDTIAPLRVKFHPTADQVLRWLTAQTAAWIVVGIISCMIQVAPVNKTVLGSDFSETVYGVQPDYYWMWFVRWSTVVVFPWDPRHAFPPPEVFRLEYQQFRPFGGAAVGR